MRNQNLINTLKPTLVIAIAAIIATAPQSTLANEKAAPTAKATKPTDGRVFFVEPVEGAKVSTKFKVKMGLEGFKIGPLGDLTPKTGHHHLLINQAPIKLGDVIPADEKHIHFGKGQTETELDLKPGKYKLTLQFADGAHRSYGPNLSSSINIEVVAP